MSNPNHHKIALNGAKVISSFSDSLSKSNAEVERLANENQRLRAGIIIYARQEWDHGEVEDLTDSDILDYFDAFDEVK